MKCGLHCPSVGQCLLVLLGAVAVVVRGNASGFCICTIAPQFLSLDKQMSEHSAVGDGPPSYSDKLEMGTCPCALYRKDPTKEEPTIGSWTLDRVGSWTFTLLPHKYGEVKLYFIVEDPFANNSAQAHIRLRIIQSPDPPQPFLDIDGFNVLSATNGAEIVVEQLSDNGDYKPYSAVIGAFDYDLNDAMVTSVTSPPLRGQVTISGASSAILGNPTSCPTTPPPPPAPASRHIRYAVAASTSTFPCDFTVPYPSEELVWTSATISYVPQTDFYGNDTFSVTIQDKNTEGTVIHFRVVILRNPCQNGATCLGPTDDPDCLLRRRNYHFHSLGYGCSCTRGWIGSTCGVDFDDCLSSPCPPYRLCKDRLNAYDCLCPANLQHCDPLLNSWQTALVVIVTGIIICLITVGLILLSRRRNAQFLDAMWRF